jgi:hypothetical protein
MFYTFKQGRGNSIHSQRSISEPVEHSTVSFQAPEGWLLIADEVSPTRTLAKLLFYLMRLPLVLLTWLLTRTSTTGLHRADKWRLNQSQIEGCLRKAIPDQGSIHVFQGHALL